MGLFYVHPESGIETVPRYGSFHFRLTDLEIIFSMAQSPGLP